MEKDIRIDGMEAGKLTSFGSSDTFIQSIHNPVLKGLAKVYKIEISVAS